MLEWNLMRLCRKYFATFHMLKCVLYYVMLKRLMKYSCSLAIQNATWPTPAAFRRRVIQSKRNRIGRELYLQIFRET